YIYGSEQQAFDPDFDAGYGDTRVALGRRSPGHDAAGKWSLFGGKPNPGESQTAAVIREVGEETGQQDIIPEFFTASRRVDPLTGEIWYTDYFIAQATG